jgi:D-alanyl-D-alanine carboxypeptidase/D-alanyl-D-alanine-endopeptidase (penicillin-binding protein 4)
VAQLFRTMLERRGIIIRGKTRARHGDDAQFFDQQIPHLPSAPAAGAASSPAVNSPIPPAMQPEKPPDLNPSSTNKIMAEHFSVPLLDDIRVINKTSENLHAELALRLVGKLRGYGGSFEGGVAAVKQFLLQASLKEDEFTFLDGSGLARRDLVTPAATVQLLIYAARQPWGPAFEESMPVSGVDGSLTDRFQKTPAVGLIHAKTGSLSHVNALSGYGQTQTGRRFVFSIFCNNHNLLSAKSIAAIDEIVKLLVSEKNSEKR